MIFFVGGCLTAPINRADYITRDEYEYGLMQGQRKDEMLAELIKGSARSDSEIRSQLFRRLRELEEKFEEYKLQIF